MKLFKPKPMTLEQQKEHQAKERLANIKRLERERKAAEVQARREAEERRRYEQERERLKRQGDIEASKTRIAAQKAARGAAQIQQAQQRQKQARAVTSMLGLTPKRKEPKRKQSVYISTSHGLKKVDVNDPHYSGIVPGSTSSPPPARRVNAKEKHDDFEQPSAFGGW